MYLINYLKKLYFSFLINNLDEALPGGGSTDIRNSVSEQTNSNESLTPKQIEILDHINALKTELDGINATKKYTSQAGSYLNKKLTLEDYEDPEAKQTIELLETYKKRFLEANQIGQNVKVELALLKENLVKLGDSFEYNSGVDLNGKNNELREELLPEEKLKNITNSEFLEIGPEQRLQYITKNHVDSENIISGDVNSIEFTFTYDGSFNKELYILTTAGQVLPSKVREVVSGGITYARAGVKGEFFNENGQRLLIHEGTNIEKITIGDVTEMLENNSLKVSKYIGNNPESSKYNYVLLEAFNREVDPKFAIIAFSEKVDSLEVRQRGVVIEEMFTQFDRIRGEFTDWNGELLDNGRYPDSVVVMLLKEFGGDSWKKKGISYGIEEGKLHEIENQNSNMFSSIDINNLPSGVNGLLDFISIYESGGNYNAIHGNATQSDIHFTNLTLREVLSYQKNRINLGLQSAIGKYQFINSTLSNLIRNHNMNLDQKFTPEFQDKIATIQLEKRGLSRYLTGTLSRDAFQRKLSMEWASLPENSDGKSYYDGKLNKAHVKNTHIDSILDNLIIGYKDA